MIIHRALLRNIGTRPNDLAVSRFCLMTHRKIRNAANSVRTPIDAQVWVRMRIGHSHDGRRLLEKIGIYRCAHEKIRERRATTNAVPDH